MRDYMEARDGFMLTNGEIYGKRIYLADSMNKEDFYEITTAEYEKISEAALQDLPA